MRLDKQLITVSHYPMMVWDKSHYGAWNLYGHVHRNDSTWDKFDETWTMGKMLNINIELHDFKPWSFEEIGDYMAGQADNWDLIKEK